MHNSSRPPRTDYDASGEAKWRLIRLFVASELLRLTPEGRYEYLAIQITCPKDEKRQNVLSFTLGVHTSEQQLSAALPPYVSHKEDLNFEIRKHLRSDNLRRVAKIFNAVADEVQEIKREMAREQIEAMNEKGRAQNYSKRPSRHVG